MRGYSEKHTTHPHSLEMKTGLLFFVGGVVAATVAKLASRCPSARQLAVRSLAKGMQVTDKAREQLQKIKSEAEDICREAEQHAHGREE